MSVTCDFDQPAGATATPISHGSPLPVYGLKQPTMADARQALDQVLGSRAQAVFETLVRRAGVRDGERNLDALARIAAVATQHDDPVVNLLGQAQGIRVAAYTRLTNVQKLVQTP